MRLHAHFPAVDYGRFSPACSVDIPRFHKKLPVAIRKRELPSTRFPSISGKVVKIISGKQFGFIRSEQVANDVYFRFSSVTNLENLAEGVEVKFQVNNKHRSKSGKSPPAMRVEVVVENDTLDAAAANLAASSSSTFPSQRHHATNSLWSPVALQKMVDKDTGDDVVTKLTSNPRRLNLLLNPPACVLSGSVSAVIRGSLRAIEFAILNTQIAYSSK